MLQFDDIRLRIQEAAPELKELSEALGLKGIREKTALLEQQTTHQDFWNDLENSQKVLQEISTLKSSAESYDNLKSQYDDAVAMFELAAEVNDEQALDEVYDMISTVEVNIQTLKLSTLLSGQYDKNNAILSFHAGAGGTEAQDWVEMLYRMYMRWSERHGYKVKVLDYLDGEEAGIKSVSILVEGKNAYGFLKSESGVHRLVRISPFDSSGRRHTSFASVEVMPEIDEDVQIDIRAEDLKVDTYRSSGAGGQHVNKTESAIRITHLPTGIVVSCQNGRSQHQNRDFAMKMLKSKLIEIKEREHLDKIDDIKGEQLQIAWGAQIRSYVFMPYTLAKDHRTGFESGNINAVMDGDLDGFINAYLKALSLGEL